MVRSPAVVGDGLMETEKQLILKVAESLTENVCKITQRKRRDLFPLQNPH